jgi:DNA (cytosine-5)-methyltransferase 1
MAGKGAGRKAQSAYRWAVHAMARGDDIDIDELDRASNDPRGHLVLEPLRWTLALRPAWIALEQVRPVLPLWETIASALRMHGYSAVTGILSAERYGVPQTRERAILMAHRNRQVALPAPTHQRYVGPRRRIDVAERLFDGGEPQRIVLPEDRHLQPWVSMAEALGWTDGDVGFPRLAETPSNEAGPHRVDIDGTEYRERDLRGVNQPALAVTSKARSWVRFRATNERPNGAERDLDEPAPSLAFGHNPPRWIVNTGRDWKEGGSREDAQEFDAEASPAPAIDGKGRWHVRTGNFTAVERDPDGRRSRAGSEPYSRDVEAPAPTLDTKARIWTVERPATTVAGDSRVWPPGHKKNAADEDAGREGYGDRAGTEAVRVSIDQAATLQSFPPYPWQGSKTKQFEQVGNAVPPLLAWHVLRELA